MEKPPSSLLHTVFETALELAATHSWDELTLTQIADQAGLPLRELYEIADKGKLADTLGAWADDAMAEEPADMNDSRRERLFDTIMRRFEKMETHRAGVLSLLKSLDKSARKRARLLHARNKTARWALACAALDHGTIAELSARQLGLVWIIAKTERAWRGDDSGDFARTMATLDAELALSEERLERFGRFSSRSKKPKAATASQPEAPQETTPED